MELQYLQAVDVVVSIVTYNSQRDIAGCLQSFAESKNDNCTCKIYIWDNASIDDTCEIIEEYVKKYPGYFNLHRSKKNIGFGAAHNRILLPLAATYKVVCNPDIRVKPETIYNCITFIENHPQCGLISPRVEYPSGEKQYLTKQLPTILDLFLRRFLFTTSIKYFRDRMERFEMKDLSEEIRYDIAYASGCFMFFPSTIFDEIHGFDERYFLHMEDADISREVGLLKQVCYVPSIIVVHDWERKMHKSLNQTICAIESMYKYFLKWGWKWW